MSASISAVKSFPTTIGQFFWYILWQCDRRLRWQFLLEVFLISFATSMVMLQSYLIKVILDTFISAQGEGAIAIEAFIVPVTGYTVCLLLCNGGFAIRSWCRMYIIPRYYENILQPLLTYTLEHSQDFFQRQLSGGIAKKVLAMADGFHHIVANSAAIILPVVINFIFLLAFLVFIHPTLGIFFFCWSLFYFGLVIPQQIHWTYQKATAFGEAKSALVGLIVDIIANSSTVQAFAQYAQELRNFIRQQSNETDYRVAFIKTSFKATLIQSLTLFISEIGVLVLLIYGFNQGWLSVGDFVLVVTLSIRFFSQIVNVTREFTNLVERFGEMKDALEILSQPHDILDREDALDLEVTGGKIDFQGVDFHYPSGHSVFEGLSVAIAPGQKVGLVGLSGAGKTTFTRLILRQFDIQGGQILIDDREIRQVTQTSLRSQIAFIPQDTALFQRSVMENIRYGRPDASDEEAIAAAKQALIHDFIEALPEGYQTLVGERGVKLSAGQRQRLAIARGILKNAPILILDEATSALDSITEQAIQRSFETLMEGRTTIAIAHRLSTLTFMDRILVFHEGQIVEDGALEELLAVGGHFARLWQSQSGGFLPEGDRFLQEKTTHFELVKEQ